MASQNTYYIQHIVQVLRSKSVRNNRYTEWKLVHKAEKLNVN